MVKGNVVAMQLPNASMHLASWFVVCTKVKCEKFVRDKLSGQGIEAFVPLTRRTVRYNRKVKVYEHPVISCYTFVKMKPEHKAKVLSIPYVLGFLQFNGRLAKVQDQDIQWLQQVSGMDLQVHTEHQDLNPGEKVMLNYGQLAGMKGEILSRKSKNDFVVALDSLGLQMVIQVDQQMLVACAG